MGILILPKIVDQVTKLNIDAVPDGDKLGKTDLTLNGPVEDLGAQSP